MTNTSDEELKHLEALVYTLHRRRRVLEIQRARLGELTPASTVLDLEDIERQLVQIRATLRQMRPGPTDAQSPYLGLLTFQEDDSTFFFGRDALIGELLSKAEQSSFLAVLGPSGSGKSSVVRAGFIPALKRGALPSSEKWQYLAPFKPGARPLNALAATLAAVQESKLGDIASIHETLSKKSDALLLMADGLLSGQTNARLVLVVDQAEELWTLAPIEPAARTAFLTDQQQPFINCLLAAANTLDHPVLIILTMRADFLHRALEHQELAVWTKTHNVLVEPLTRDELHSAITRPAELVGGGFEPGLVDTLVEQTVSRPGALPLLEYTLLELWKERQPDGTLGWETFKRIGGGVEGGLARRADSVLAKQYTPEQQAELRAVLLRLVQPGEGAMDTRRRVALDDLVPAGSSSEAVQALLKPLADERLITTGFDPESNEEIVEVSHEALIRAWPTLGGWISTARGDLRLHIQLGEAAKEWVTSGENPDLLWSGLRLANTEAWLDRARPRLNARDQRFLDAGGARRQAQIEAEQARSAAEEAARQHELEQARALAASAMRLQRRAIYLGVALFATVVVAALAGWFWYSAKTEEQRAFAQFLVAKGQAVYEEHPLLGTRLVLEGLAWLPQGDAAHTDVMSITAQLIKQGRLENLANDGTSIQSSPDNTIFILGRQGNVSELRHSIDGSLVTTLTGEINAIAFSPDSKLVVVDYFDGPSELRRVDGSLVRTLADTAPTAEFSSDSKLLMVTYVHKPNELRHSIDGSLVPLTGTINNLVFSPDSKLFVVYYSDMPGELRRVDGSLVRTLTTTNAGTATGVVFSPDSKLFVVYYDGEPIELRRADGSLVTTLTGDILGVYFSPDSKLFMVSYRGKPSELRRMDGSLVRTLTDTITDIPNSVVFSPDSKLFVVNYSSRKPSELRRVDGSLVTTLTGDIFEVYFSPDSKLFVARYLTKPGELWRVDGSLVTTYNDTINEVIFSSDGKLLAVRFLRNYGELWELQGPTQRIAPIANLGGLTFDPEAQHLFALLGSGQFYKLDIAWLSAAASYPETVSEGELITRTCAGPLSPTQFDEKELKPYLGTRTARACI